MIIINADDLGKSSEINEAILIAFQREWISNASLIVNMPGFNQACNLIKEYKLTDKIGVHLNITEGLPISEPIKKCRRFCTKDGTFTGKHLRLFHLDREEAQALDIEFQAQIQACIAAGIFPVQIDSHHHYHTEWALSKIVINLALRNRIPAVRLSRNCGTQISLVKRAYKYLYNARLSYWGLAKTRYFGNLPDIQSLLPATNLRGVLELMVHPVLANDGRIIDNPHGMDLKELVDSLGPCKLLSYAEASSFLDSC